MHVSTKFAAEAIEVHPSTLWRWWRKRGIVTPASITMGGHARWDIEDLKLQLAELLVDP